MAAERKQRAEEEARAEERRAAEHAASLAAAQRDLQDAIEGVRVAKRAGKGTVEADTRWRAAKARVIELETGAPPAWAADRSTLSHPADDGLPVTD